MDQNSQLEFKLLCYLALTGWIFIEGACDDTASFENDLGRNVSRKTDVAVKLELTTDYPSNITIEKLVETCAGENYRNESDAINKLSIETVLNKSLKSKELYNVNHSPELYLTDELFETTKDMLNATHSPELHETDEFLTKQSRKDLLDLNHLPELNLTDELLEQTAKDKLNVSHSPELNLTDELFETTKDKLNVTHSPELHETDEFLAKQSRKDLLDLNHSPELYETDELLEQTTKNMLNVSHLPELYLTDELLEQTTNDIFNVNHSSELNLTDVFLPKQTKNDSINNSVIHKQSNLISPNLTNELYNKSFFDNLINICSTRLVRQIAIERPPNYTKPLVKLCIAGRCINTTNSKMLGVQPFIPVIIKADPPPKNEEELQHLVDVVYEYQNELGALNSETGLRKLLDGRLFIKNLEVVRQRCHKDETTPSNVDLIKILAEDVTGTRMLTNAARKRKTYLTTIPLLRKNIFNTDGIQRRTRKRKNRRIQKLKYKRNKILEDALLKKLTNTQNDEIDMQITHIFNEY